MVRNQIKRSLAVLLAAIMLLAILPVSGALAATGGKCGDNLTWALDDNGTLTISGTGEMYDLDYGDTLWCDYNDSIKAAVIENGVTGIGDCAFSGCNSLTNITIPESVTGIGEYAFSDCDSLTNITIPESVTSIGEFAFQWCRSLKSVTLPNSLTDIERGLFNGCESLETVAIPNSVANIGGGAFGDCTGLTSIYVAEDNLNYLSENGVLFNKEQTTLIKYPSGKTDSSYSVPNSVTYIENEAFSYCRNLTNMTIPNSVTSIGEFAFSYCTSLTNVTLPPNIQTISNGLFYDCVKLERLTISDKVTTIGEYAFSGCDSLTSLILPNSVTSIDFMAFDMCRSLTSVIILNSETTIERSAFDGCDNLTIYGYSGSTAEEYANNNGIRFKPVCLHSSESCTEFDEVPATCTQDGYTAGVYCNECDSWISGHELIKAHHTDSNSDGICDICGGETELSIRVDERKTVEIVAGEITYIKFVPEVSGEYTFTSHSNDDTYGYLFDGNNEKIASDDDDGEHNNFSITADLEAGKTYYWGATYLDDDKSGSFEVSLTKSSDSDEKSGKCGDNLTWTLDDNGTLTISGTGEMYGWHYDGHTLWYDCNDSIKAAVIENGVTSIGDSAFKSCEKLTSVAISDSVTSIGRDAFDYCKSLTSVIIPNSVTSIGSGAFSVCLGLNSITIPDSVISIGDSAFYYCENLTNVKISTNLTSIGHQMFLYCKNLESITIPNSVTSIDDSAFQYCESLTSVTISNNLKNIGDAAFFGCISLTNVAIPKSVTSIGDMAFHGCDSLTSISVAEDNPDYSSSNGILFNKDKTVLIKYPSSKAGATYAVPNSVQKILDYAIMDCNNLTSATIPSSVASIGYMAFAGCDNLTSITVAKDNTAYSSLNGVLFNKDKTELLKYPAAKADSAYSIPNGVKQISNLAFEGSENLTNITIPNSVTDIGNYAFLNCRNMKSIIIPSSVTHIGEYALGYYEVYNEAMGNYPELMTDFTIYGQKGSEAEKYSEFYNVKFAVYSHTHSYKSAVTKKATCTADGVMTYTCSCGDKYTKVIKATGHKYTTSTVKATQTKDGSTVTKCTVCGAVKSKTVIAKASSVKLSNTSFTYNGKAQKPSVTVKDSKGKTLKNGTDYTVKYSSGCKNVGQYTVTITFKGKYSGTKTLTFKIVPKGTSISKLSSGKKQFTAKWSKQTTQTTGYELQYSTKSSMSGAKTVTVGKNKTTSSTVKKLKGGKKYYVRIRTYKTVKVNGKSVKLYSSWSNVKSVKTK